MRVDLLQNFWNFPQLCNHCTPNTSTASCNNGILLLVLALPYLLIHFLTQVLGCSKRYAHDWTICPVSIDPSTLHHPSEICPAAATPYALHMHVYLRADCICSQFAHPGEKARRRDPQHFTYAGIACPDMKKVHSCCQTARSCGHCSCKSFIALAEQCSRHHT